jgi:hypothetical protein
VKLKHVEVVAVDLVDPEKQLADMVKHVEKSVR